VGLNAFTNADETGYFFSFPSNRLELWAYLESERFLRPVMREFYKERDVVMEERRMRTESQPIGRLVEQFAASAYTAHSYGRPVVGWMSDLQSFSASDAADFTSALRARQHGGGGGRRRKRRSSCRWPRSILDGCPRSPGRRPADGRARAEGRAPGRSGDLPAVLHRGVPLAMFNDPDAAVYSAIETSFSGRIVALYRSLVRDKKIAAQAAGFSARQQVPEPLRLLRRSHSRPHPPTSALTPSGRRSSGSRARTWRRGAEDGEDAARAKPPGAGQ
jgi:hypothetical protein